jgi:hypothetical protein
MILCKDVLFAKSNIKKKLLSNVLTVVQCYAKTVQTLLKCFALIAMETLKINKSKH